MQGERRRRKRLLSLSGVCNRRTSMASLQLYLLLALLLHSIFLIDHCVICDDEEDNLLKSINDYRASLNLTALVKNEKAGCLASEIADQFKGKACTNSTGSNTVPGTEPQFSDYPKLLDKCDLNVTNTRDGVIMPACVPDLVEGLVLSNFTHSQYSQHLNDTQYSGAGIGSDNDWIVVILTTNTSAGSFVGEESAASMVSKVGLIYSMLFLLLGFLFL